MQHFAAACRVGSLGEMCLLDVCFSSMEFMKELRDQTAADSVCFVDVLAFLYPVWSVKLACAISLGVLFRLPCWKVYSKCVCRARAWKGILELKVNSEKQTMVIKPEFWVMLMHFLLTPISFHYPCLPSLLAFIYSGEAPLKWLGNLFGYGQREVCGMVISGEPMD